MRKEAKEGLFAKLNGLSLEANDYRQVFYTKIAYILYTIKTAGGGMSKNTLTVIVICSNGP